MSSQAVSRSRLWLTLPSVGLPGLILASILLVVTVTAQEGAPLRPTGLQADASHDRVRLDWDDPRDETITGYQILRRLPALDPPGEFAVLVDHTESAATTFSDDSVTPQTSYVSRVKAINAPGASERSSFAPTR